MSPCSAPASSLRCSGRRSRRSGSAGRGSCAAALPKRSMCPGQFIGLIAACGSSSSPAIRNMFSRNFSQWPRRDPERLVVDQRRLHLGVAAAARSRAGAGPRARSRSPSPSGARTASPGDSLGEVEEVELAAEPPVVARLRLLEPLEVARRDRPASRRRCRRSASAACSARRRASTRRRATVSLTALIGFESWRCGPRQRSVKSPCV